MAHDGEVSLERMAAILSREISPSWAIQPTAMKPVIKLAIGTKMLSYNAN